VVTLEYFDRSDIGQLRKVNQDLTNIVVNSHHQLLAIVCDGMGGHLAGETAAKLVVSEIVEEFNKIDYFSSTIEAKLWIREIIAKANTRVYQHSFEKEYQGMGTTIVLCIVLDSICLITHVGDSRAYYINNQVIEQITKDHTFVNMLIDTGSISKEQAKNHPKRNVLMKAVGVFKNLKVDVLIKEVHQGKLLLCSDGLYNGLDEKDIHLITTNNKLTVEQRVNQLIKLTNDQGGYDNIGIVLIDFDEEDLKNGD